MKTPTLGLVLLSALAACGPSDEAQPSPTAPVRAALTPATLEKEIGDSYAHWWEVAHSWFGNAITMDVMANHGTSSWGNFGLNDLGREPRQPVSDYNQPSYRWSYVFERPFSESYRAINQSSNALRGLLALGDEQPHAVSFAKFVQGLAGCQIALIYDEGLQIDENTVGLPPFVPYRDVMDFYQEKFEQAHRIASRRSFTLPGTWINGNPLRSGEFAALIRNYQARCEANLPRTPAENAAAPWSQVLQWLEQGDDYRDLVIDGVDSSSGSPWWDGIKTLGGAETTSWIRAHMDWVGLSDQSGAYQNWLMTPLLQRTPFVVSTPDLRFPRNALDGDRGLYQKFHSIITFRPERGQYRQSHYGDHRWESYLNSCNFCWFGPIPEMLSVELDLIEAEAALETGNAARALQILNRTRVANGGLSPLVGEGVVPQEPGGGCVPRKRFDPSGACGDLRDALIWEHMNEVFQLSGGLTYFFLRGQGQLPAGTSLHFPVPVQFFLPPNGAGLQSGAVGSPPVTGSLVPRDNEKWQLPPRVR